MRTVPIIQNHWEDVWTFSPFNVALLALQNDKQSASPKVPSSTETLHTYKIILRTIFLARSQLQLQINLERNDVRVCLCFPCHKSISFNYTNKPLENYFCCQVTITITWIILMRTINVRTLRNMVAHKRVFTLICWQSGSANTGSWSTWAIFFASFGRQYREHPFVRYFGPLPNSQWQNIKHKLFCFTSVFGLFAHRARFKAISCLTWTQAWKQGKQ